MLKQNKCTPWEDKKISGTGLATPLSVFSDQFNPSNSGIFTESYIFVLLVKTLSYCSASGWHKEK